MRWLTVASLALLLPLSASAKFDTFYSGQLVDACGEPLIGTYYLKLAFYDAASDGNLICGESPTAPDYPVSNPEQVDLHFGHFSIPIPGCYNAFEEENSKLWVELTVLNELGDIQMTLPRQEIGSVPQAGSARRAAGTLENELNYRNAYQNRLRNTRYTNTTEIPTGKSWIDGRPIYRRFIQDLHATGLQTYVQFDFEMITDAQIGIFTSTAGNYPHTRKTGAYISTGGSIYPGGGNTNGYGFVYWAAYPKAADIPNSQIILHTNFLTNGEWFGWFEYTKLQDEPCSAPDLNWNCNPANYPPAEP